VLPGRISPKNYKVKIVEAGNTDFTRIVSEVFHETWHNRRVLRRRVI